MNASKVGEGMSDERMKALYDSFTKGGRPLEELLKTKDPLKGAEAQRVRGHATSYGLHPADCADFELVAALMTGKRAKLEERFEADVKSFGGGAEGKAKAVTKWEEYRDSPNQLPIYDILQIGAYSELIRQQSIREAYFDSLEYLISQGIAVEGTDVAGYTALQHSLSCTPLCHDFRWSALLLDASKDPIAAINHRNRYGATALHEAVMCYKRPGEEEIRLEAIKWAMERGANVDIPDGDGSTTWRTAARFSSFMNLFAEHDSAVALDHGCAFCRRGGVAGKGKGKVETKEAGEVRASLRCGRCKERSYCSAGCQKASGFEEWDFQKLTFELSDGLVGP